VSPKISCWGLFGRLNILPFYSQYMYFSLLLVAKNASKFVNNNDIYIYMINTQQNTNLYLPSVNLSKYKKRAYHMGTKIFNHLLRDIWKLLYDANKFKVVIKKFFKGIFLLNK
jgi:hypothetical protein